jgi:hypothetical protein
MSKDQVKNVVETLFRTIKSGGSVEDGVVDGVTLVVADNILSLSVGGKEHSVFLSKVKNKKVSAKNVVDILCGGEEETVEETPAPEVSEEECSAPDVEVDAPVAVEETPVVAEESAPVKEKQVRVYTRKPGPKGKRSEGTDYDVCKSVLSEELAGVRLVSREVLQSACDRKTGSKFALQVTHWSRTHRYHNGSERPAILLNANLGKKSGVFINPFFNGVETAVVKQESVEA